MSYFRARVANLCKLLVFMSLVLSGITRSASAEAPGLFREYLIGFEYVSRCHIGDLNLISFELDREQWSRRRMILTVESLDNKRVYLSKEILSSSENYYDDPTNYQIFKDNFSVKLPRVMSPQIVGVYLCKDSDRHNRCGDNELVDFEKLEKFYEIPAENFDFKNGQIINLAKTYKKDVEVEDRIYFFRPAILTSTGLQIIPEVNSAAKYEELARLYAGEQQDEFQEKMINASRSTRSLSMTLEHHRLALKMPYMDLERCFGTAIENFKAEKDNKNK